jgi:hypothetical protein
MPVAMLWHLRPVSVLGLVGDVATTLVVGTGMALVVETPVLRLRDRFFPARSQASASGLEGPVIASQGRKRDGQSLNPYRLQARGNKWLRL